jgi:putative CocE/NonD family hydrolase
MRRESVYVRGEGGVRIAVDAWIPDSERRPAVLTQHRYWRAAELRWPFGRGGPRPGAFARTLLRAGYAVVDMDVRGTGASFGSRSREWAPDEAADAAAAIDWIVSRSWSDGRVAAVGVSYAGSAALLLAAHGHPALRAVAVQFCFFDLADDLVLPGGIRNTWIVERWGAMVHRLDRGRLPVSSVRARLAVRGPRPVAGDRRLLSAALAEHAGNGDAAALGRAVAAADIRGESPGAVAGAIRASGVAVHSLGGWYDGAATRAAVEIHRALGGELVLGPWDHGGYHDCSPQNPSGEMRFDIPAEVVGFLDRALAGDGDAVRAVRYYTVGEERWKSSRTWPPSGTATLPLYLHAGGALAPSAPVRESTVAYRVDAAASTGPRSRWRSQLQPAPATRYPARSAAAARCLVYTSEPLHHGLEITGEPVCALRLSADTGSAHVFCYVDAVAPDGAATYVTEGLAAASAPWPAAVRVVLQPISFAVPPGGSLRLSLACADGDVFAPPADPPSELRLDLGGADPARIELPVVARGGQAPAAPADSR